MRHVSQSVTFDIGIKTRIVKHVFRIFAFLLFAQSALASHYLGGEITWRCFDSGPNAGKYKFYVILYRECGTGASTFLPNPVVLSTNAPGGSISCAQVGSATDVSPNCWDGTQEINCNGVTSGQGAVEERRYESGYITLSGVPPAGGWYFTFHGLLPSFDYKLDVLIEFVHAPCVHVPLFH